LGSVWIRSRVHRLTRTAVAGGERIPGGDEKRSPPVMGIPFHIGGGKDPRQGRRVGPTVEVRSGHRSGHFGEQGSGSRVLCQTRRDSIGRGTFARYVLLGLGIFTGGWVTIFYFIGDPRIGDPPPIGGRDRTRSIESNVEDQMLAILTLDLGPRDFGPTTGRDTLFHREMPGDFGPRSRRRGSDRRGKIGTTGGKRLAGRSVGPDTLFHKVVDPAKELTHLRRQSVATGTSGRDRDGTRCSIEKRSKNAAGGKRLAGGSAAASISRELTRRIADPVRTLFWERDRDPPT
jgi:hypothetical protein